MTNPAHLSPAQSTRLLLICSAVCFFCFFGAYMRIPVFPLFANLLGADTGQVGLLNALFLLMSGLLCVPAGLWSDRVGRRIPILGGLLLLGSASLSLYFSTSLLQLMAVCALSGIGTAVVTPALMSYVADITPAARLGGAFACYTTCLYAGMTAGPAVGGLLGRVLGYRAVFLSTGCLVLTLFVVALVYLPDSRSHVLGAGVSAPKRPTVGALLSNRRLVVCLSSMLGSCIGYGMFISFVPLYARSLGLNLAQTGLVFAAQALANALVRVPFGRLGDRLGDRSTLVVSGLIGFAVSLLLLGSAESLSGLLAGSTLFGATLGIAFTALVALTADAVPREQRGLALGLYNSCLYLGMMLSSAVMGLVIGHWGYHVAFLSCAGLSLLVGCCFRLLHRVPPEPDRGMAPCESEC